MKFLLRLSLIIILITFFVKPVFAHPTDVGYENLRIASQKQIDAEFFLSWTQIVILGEDNKSQAVVNFQNPESELSFMDHVQQIISENKEYIKNYIRRHAVISNMEKKCAASGIEFPEPDKMQLLFGKGIEIDANYLCEKNINSLKIQNDMLFDRFPLQTHVIMLSLKNQKIEKVISKKNPSYEFAVAGDRISNTKAPLLQKNLGLIEKLINNFVESRNSLFLSFLLVFILGVIHTLEPGHSKTILSALLIDKKFSWRHGIIYSVIFTITHISDILILGSLLLIASSFTNVFTKLPYLEKISAVGILIISSYLIFKNIKEIRAKNKKTHMENHVENKNLSFKNQLALGFLTGLAPCLTGWSIFFVATSSRVSWSIIPIIIFFGFGIFTALIVLILGSLFFKKKVLNRFSRVSIFLPLLSSILLFLFALKLLI